MGDVNDKGVGLGSVARVRVRIRSWVTCMGRIRLQLELGSGFNVREIRFSCS